MNLKSSRRERGELPVECSPKSKFNKNKLFRRMKKNHENAPVECPENKQQAFKTNDQLEAPSGLWPGGKFGVGNF